MLGIANSVELLQGDLTYRKHVLCKNEQKLLFKPYTRDDMIKVLEQIATQAVAPYSVALADVLHPKVLQLAASKIDKLSGDIRVCFDIIRNVVQAKMSQKVITKIELEDALQVVNQMYQSPLQKVILKMPRSCVLLLECILQHCEDEGAQAEMTSQ